MDKENRKKYRVLAVKEGMATIGHDVKEIAGSASSKVALTTCVGLGALVVVLGVASQDPAKIAIGLTAGGTIDALAIATLKDTSGFISIKEQINHLAFDIREMKRKVSSYSEPSKGRSL